MSANRLYLDIEKKWENFNIEISQEFSFEAPVAIFGASGSGKSSLLRMISGLETPDNGSIRSSDGSGIETVWYDRKQKIDEATHKRQIGYLFQDGRLFPHLSPIENLKYADKRSKHQNSQLSLDSVIENLNLSSLLNKTSRELSGGETQRIVLGRTLLSRPSLLLLDEPLTGLDRERKTEILPYLESLQSNFSIPIILVSHDIEEVLRLTGSTLIISEGRKIAFGKTQEVFVEKPLEDLQIFTQSDSSLFVGVVKNIDKEMMLAEIDVLGQQLFLPQRFPLKVDQKIAIKIRMQDVGIATIYPQNTSFKNIIPCVVRSFELEETSPFGEVVLDVNGHSLKSRITRASLINLGLKAGMNVFALIKSASFQDHSI